jgi:hypothetical protein
MFRIRNILPLAALLVGAAILGAPAQARAFFQISVFVDGTNQGVTTTGSAINFGVNATVTDFTVVVGSLTNFPGTSASAFETNTTNNSVTATTSFATSHTVTIVVSENFWTAPGGPVLLSSSAGGSIVDAVDGGFSVAATNQGFVDNSNTLATTVSPGGVSTTKANASASLGGVGTDPLVYSPSPATQTASGGTPFALTQVFVYTFSAGAGAGDSAGGSGTVSVTTVPAPSEFVLGLTAIPFLGIGAWLRRRRLACLPAV